MAERINADEKQMLQELNDSWIGDYNKSILKAFWSDDELAGNAYAMISKMVGFYLENHPLVEREARRGFVRVSLVIDRFKKNLLKDKNVPTISANVADDLW